MTRDYRFPLQYFNCILQPSHMFPPPLPLPPSPSPTQSYRWYSTIHTHCRYGAYSQTARISRFCGRVMIICSRALFALGTVLLIDSVVKAFIRNFQYTIMIHAFYNVSLFILSYDYSTNDILFCLYKYSFTSWYISLVQTSTYGECIRLVSRADGVLPQRLADASKGPRGDGTIGRRLGPFLARRTPTCVAVLEGV